MRDSRPWIGLALVLVVATSFALNSASAGLAFEGGTNALTVLTVRTVIAAGALFALLAWQGARATLPRRDRRMAIALGLVMGLYSYFLYAAIERIPVALAILTFYLYPILTALAYWAWGRGRIGLATAVALVAAFAGLALALDMRGDGLDPVGVGFAAAAALTFALVPLLSEPLIGAGDSRPVTLHMLAVAAMVYVVASAVSGDFVLPETRLGWIGMLLVPAFYTFAIVGFFVAVGMIGPVRTSLAMNFEPVASMIFGFLVLGQTLTYLQILGGALVVAAIVVVRTPAAAKTSE